MDDFSVLVSELRALFLVTQSQQDRVDRLTKPIFKALTPVLAAAVCHDLKFF